jgi:hypothetical protein
MILFTGGKLVLRYKKYLKIFTDIEYSIALQLLLLHGKYNPQNLLATTFTKSGNFHYTSYYMIYSDLNINLVVLLANCLF